MPTIRERSLIISYLAMRRLIGGLGVLLPLIVVIGGTALGDARLQVTISAYYYTNMRDCYVGILSGVALFLLSYRGYERIDGIVSTLGGISALGLIVFPTVMGTGQSGRVGVFLLTDDISHTLHAMCGGLFFLSLSFMSIFLFTRRHPGVMGREKRRRNVIYRTCGVIMILAVVCIALYALFWSETSVAGVNPMLILESVALFAFGVSWIVKGNTLFKDRSV
jgi:hypothetical protein